MNSSFSSHLKILLFGFFVTSLYQAVSEVYIDGGKGLKRDKVNNVAFGNFAVHKFFYLSLPPLVSTSVKDVGDCARLCVDNLACFSVNFAVMRDQDGNITCEVLPSDKYNNSGHFNHSAMFHHLSIKNPCSSGPCLNNATCVAKYEDDDYQCACVPGFYGRQCENIVDCRDMRKRAPSQGDGMYWLDPDGGSHSNAFLAYCDMTLYNGGWTMCYTTDEYVQPKTEVTYNAKFPYGSDGYRTNCNDISFTEIIFVDHQTRGTAYFKRRTGQSIRASLNYGKQANTYGLWDGVGTNNAYSYQLLICDTSFYSGFFVSGYTGNCYKHCNTWCADLYSPYFRTTSTGDNYKGVAFNINGHRTVNYRLISVGLR
ncbi:uncharacterized protein LOC111327912 [Stylophora pistillata]|uniref:uncharacterized protein LOC111327912 n=1 Tax=Stylophora pistillata TaxID=50429 RepID=UPI000C054417|nr:uncharacterized protein LOC111327912 [Stylophora pistillata]